MATGLAVPVSAQAQEAATQSDPATGLVEDQQEESHSQTTTIVVTAEFREADLQDTPIAITAVKAQMLEARGQTDIQQVASQAPNVTLKPQGQINGTGLVAFIRGIGETNYNYALEPGVGIYIDDVYYPTVTGSLLDLTDVERVEVLRGPQGTLAGRNSIGGAIKLFSSKPSGDDSGSIQAIYGSFNRIDVRAFADFEITDTLLARIAGTTKNRDGYVTRLDYALTHPGSNVPTQNSGDDVELGTLGGVSYAAARLSLRWLASDAIEVNVSGDYTSDKSEAGASVLRRVGPRAASSTPDGRAFLVGTDGQAVPYDCRFVPYGQYSCDTLPASSGYDRRYINYETFLDLMPASNQLPFKPYYTNPIRHYTGGGVQGRIDFDLADNFQLTSISAYREYTSRFGTAPDASPVPSQAQFNKLDFNFFSQEVRLNGEVLDGLLDFTVGGYYSDQNKSLNARVLLNYSGLDFEHGPDTTPASSKAGFLNVSVHPTPELSLTGGLRYTKDEKTYTYFRSNPDGTIPPPCNFAAPGGPLGNNNPPNCLQNGIYDLTDSFEGDRWDYRAVIDYRFSDQFLAYASVATGYKGGGVNPFPYYGPALGMIGLAAGRDPAVQPAQVVRARDAHHLRGGLQDRPLRPALPAQRRRVLQ
jgi:iron complex outermembrane receptor protein